ncbi:MAG: RNA polymerase sigma factor [Prevotella sp.]|jgi:RNA polymerase sigma-70 factor (ECF subfamily)
MDRLKEKMLISEVALFHNNRAFDKLVVEHQSAVRRFLLTLTSGDQQLADDLAQDTFVKAWLRISMFQARSSFKTWLFRIAYNNFYDYKRSLHPTYDLEQPAVRQQTASSSSLFDLDYEKALQKLNDAERICVTLQLNEGQSIDEIVKITGIVAGTVKSNLSRGKHKLMEYLKENGYE